LVVGKPTLAVELHECSFLSRSVEVGEFPTKLVFHESGQFKTDGHGKSPRDLAASTNSI
jgi:hypothetical protein